MKDLALSVVIPTLGRDTLLKTVESLVSARGSDAIDIIIVGKVEDDAVADALWEIRSSFENIKHLPLSFDSGDSSNKKNAGYRESKSNIVAFVDDDVIVSKDWPARIIKVFDDPEVGMVSGPSLVPTRDKLSLMPRLASATLSSRAAGYVAERYLEGKSFVEEIKWSRIIGCNMAFRKEILEELGGFDARFWPGEEMLCAFMVEKKGCKIIFHSGAFLYHYPRASLCGFIKQIYGYGVTRIRLIREGVELEVSTLVPAVWVFSLFAFVVLAFFSKIMFYLLLVDLAAYLMFDMIITFMKYFETREAESFLIFFLTPLMHISYGIGEWVEFLRPNKDLSVRGEG